MSWSAKPYRGAPGDYEFELATDPALLGERQKALADKAGAACESLAQALVDAEEISVSASGHANEQPPGDSIYISVASLAPVEGS